MVQDDEFELELMKAAPWAYTLDEWRARGNKEALGEANGGNMHMMPINHQLVDPADPPPPPSANNGGVDASGEDNNSKINHLTLGLDVQQEVLSNIDTITEQVTKRLEKNNR